MCFSKALTIRSPRIRGYYTSNLRSRERSHVQLTTIDIAPCSTGVEVTEPDSRPKTHVTSTKAAIGSRYRRRRSLLYLLSSQENQSRASMCTRARSTQASPVCKPPSVFFILHFIFPPATSFIRMRFFAVVQRWKFRFQRSMHSVDHLTEKNRGCRKWPDLIL
jgi:hypothetical protein